MAGITIAFDQSELSNQNATTATVTLTLEGAARRSTPARLATMRV